MTLTPSLGGSSGTYVGSIGEHVAIVKYAQLNEDSLIVYRGVSIELCKYCMQGE